MILLELSDEGSMTELIMLYLYASFHIIHYLILMDGLEFSFGIKRKSLIMDKSCTSPIELSVFQSRKIYIQK